MSATYKDEGHGDYRCLLCRQGWLDEHRGERMDMQDSYYECDRCKARWDLECENGYGDDGTQVHCCPGDLR